MPLELSHFKRFYSFPDFFPRCVQLLHWNFVHGFISMTYRSSSKMVAIDQFVEELCPLDLAILRDFTVFLTFFPQCVQLLHWNFVRLYINDLQIKFEDCCYQPILLEEFCPLNLTILRDFTVCMLVFYSFRDFSPTICTAIAF
jgi:hypothetical protein